VATLEELLMDNKIENEKRMSPRRIENMRLRYTGKGGMLRTEDYKAALGRLWVPTADDSEWRAGLGRAVSRPGGVAQAPTCACWKA